MSLRLRLLILAAGAVLAALVYPIFTSPETLGRAALALALAGPAAGAAVAAAAGRPPLAAAALAGVGAYVSGLLALSGIPVPLSVLVGTLAGGLAGGAVAALGARLSGAGFLLATLVLTLLGAGLVQALPRVTGAEAGLGPLPALGVPLGGFKTAILTPTGNFHALLVVAVLSTALAAFLLQRGPGPRWRAVGSDRERAAGSRLAPFEAQVTAVAFAGLLAALSGAFAAHASQIATPQSFAPDLAALPLLAALTANRQPLGAALIAVATGFAGGVVLPALGWHGPPDAMSLAIGILAVAALFTLLPGGGPAHEEPEAPAIDPGAPWPLAGLELQGRALSAKAVRVTAPAGEVLVDAPAFEVPSGGMLAVVGPNGAGKTTLLRAVVERARSGDPTVAVTGGDGIAPHVSLLPQEGGGFASCTVDETLTLAARRGRSREAAAQIVQAWVERLGLESSRNRFCFELSTGQRRLLDLARVLLGNPSVLLCDEPLAGLDDSHRAAATSLLKASAGAGLTVMVAEHDRDAVAALGGGRLELERPGWAPAAGAAAEPA